MPLEWSVNPWRDRPWRAATAMLVGLGMCVVVLAQGEPTLLETALCLAVIASLSPLLSPARLRVDDEGVSRRGPFGLDHRNWKELRRAVTGGPSVLLSPFQQPHWLDPFRGLWLPLPSRNSEALLVELRERLQQHGL